MKAASVLVFLTALATVRAAACPRDVVPAARTTSSPAVTATRWDLAGSFARYTAWRSLRPGLATPPQPARRSAWMPTPCLRPGTPGTENPIAPRGEYDGALPLDGTLADTVGDPAERERAVYAYTSDR